MISMILMINVFTQPRALQCSASECNKATEENLVLIYQNDSGSPFHHVSPILALPLAGLSTHVWTVSVLSGAECSGVVVCCEGLYSHWASLSSHHHQ